MVWCVGYPIVCVNVMVTLFLFGGEFFEFCAGSHHENAIPPTHHFIRVTVVRIYWDTIRYWGMWNGLVCGYHIVCVNGMVTLFLFGGKFFEFCVGSRHENTIRPSHHFTRVTVTLRRKARPWCVVAGTEKLQYPDTRLKTYITTVRHSCPRVFHEDMTHMSTRAFLSVVNHAQLNSFRYIWGHVRTIDFLKEVARG